MTDQEKKITDSPAPRSESLRKELVSAAGFAAMGAVPPKALASDGSASGPELGFPLKSQRMVRDETIGALPHQQHYGEVEMIGGNDVKVLIKTYVKRTDTGNTYDTVSIVVEEHYQRPTDIEPVFAAIASTAITGIKGDIDGDYRLDTVTTTNGSTSGISTDGPRQIRVLLKDPTAGMSEQDKFKNGFLYYTSGE